MPAAMTEESNSSDKTFCDAELANTYSAILTDVILPINGAKHLLAYLTKKIIVIAKCAGQRAAHD
jgi:hypothetical protein